MMQNGSNIQISASMIRLIIGCCRITGYFLFKDYPLLFGLFTITSNLAFVSWIVNHIVKSRKSYLIKFKVFTFTMILECIIHLNFGLISMIIRPF
jgi:hypothetical protein